MKSTFSALFFFSLISGIQFSLGCSNVSAQSPEGQVTGHEFTRWKPEGFSDSQFNLLWNAYNLKSDSLLEKFFTNWRLETQILEEPSLESPISNATASLFVFLLNTDFQNSVYPYEFAVIQNQVEATVSSSSWSSQNGYVLINFHPPSSNPEGPRYILLDDRHNVLLGEFLGDWSVLKAQAAGQFFGNYVPFGADVYYYNKQADWSLIRHWYSFQFTSDLQEAFVTDETPTGEINYTCIIGPDGTWIRVSNDAVILEPLSPTGPPDEPYYPPPDFPPYPPPRPPHPHHPPHGPDPIPPTGGTIVPVPAPQPPVGRPRPIATPTHTNNPSEPADPGRPRTIPPPEHNPVSPPLYQPVSPQNPSQPERHRTDSPSNSQPTPPQQAPVQRQRTNSPSPPPPAPTERPRTVQPAPSNTPTTRSTSPENPPKPTPPPDKKDQDQKRERGR